MFRKIVAQLQLYKLLGLKRAHNKTQCFLEEIASCLLLTVVCIKILKVLSETEDGLIFWIFNYERIQWGAEISVKAMGVLVKSVAFSFLVVLISYCVRQNWYVGSRSWSYRLSMIMKEFLKCVWSLWKSLFIAIFSSLNINLNEIGNSYEFIRYVRLKVQCLVQCLEITLGFAMGKTKSENSGSSRELQLGAGHGTLFAGSVSKRNPTTAAFNSTITLPLYSSTPKIAAPRSAIHSDLIHGYNSSHVWQMNNSYQQIASEVQNFHSHTRSKRLTKMYSPKSQEENLYGDALHPLNGARGNFNLSLSNFPSPSSPLIGRVSDGSVGSMTYRAGQGDQYKYPRNNNGNVNPTNYPEHHRHHRWTPTAAAGDFIVTRSPDNPAYNIAKCPTLKRQQAFFPQKNVFDVRNEY